jgi:FKBP-type peptidyl-prolyl cis-trans isomerase
MRLKATFICFATLSIVCACGKSEEGDADRAGVAVTPGTDTAVAGSASSDVSTEIMPGLTMRILREGNGTTAQTGDIAIVHYTGWLYDDNAPDKRGTKFDSSVDRDQHFQFALGAGRVIRGWDEGVAGMKEGEIRELTIAPELAYGERNVGNGMIPPGSTLVFEVELARTQSVQPQMQIELPGTPD